MRELNAAWFERDGTTDVFSFRYPALPGEEPGVSGEVVVNVEEACRQGARRSRSSPQRELALYIAHGFHHLAGADDNTPARRRAMIRTEWRRVAAAARSVPLEELLT
jgi:rRNA maturation RNase YbeY